MTISVTSNYTTLALSEANGIVMGKAAGLADLKAQVNTAAYASGIGSHINGASIPTRNIVLTLYPLHPVKTSRVQLYGAFPVGEEVTLTFTDGSASRTISGIVEGIEGDLYEAPQTMQVSILCPFPFFADTQTVGSSSGGTNPITLTIDNPGDRISPVTLKTTITASGASTITFENTTHSETLVLNVANATIGDTYTITSGPNERQVYKGQNSALGEIDLANAVWPALHPGANTFVLTTTGSVAMFMAYGTPLYGGL